MDDIFNGLRVVELAGDVAGEQVGRMLALAGADVVKVEPPEGSPTRSVGPFAGTDDRENSLTFWFYNTNKRSMTVDLADHTGQDQLWSVLSDADVILTTRHPVDGPAEQPDAHELRSRCPRAIVVSITPFGLTGPRSHWRSSDLVGLALGGVLNSCGYDDHTIPPIRPGGDQGLHLAASAALMALMVAVIQRDLEDPPAGDLIDIAMHDALAVGAELANPYWFYPRALVQRQTCRHAQPTPTQPALFECGDGRYVYFVMFVTEQKGWRALVEWMDSKDLATDLIEPDYDDPAFRQANFAHIQGVMEAFFLLHSAEEIYQEGQSHGLAIGILNAPEEVVEDEHLRSREYLAPVALGNGREALFPRLPIRFSGVDAPEVRRAPMLGEHADEFLQSSTPRRGDDA